jgi:di/tricarboxylate transporter
MTLAGILLLVLLSVAIVFFITEWLRADLVALLLLVALGVTGILTPQETLSGFSRSAVITIRSIYILTAGLARTGATRILGARLMRLGGQGEVRLSVVLMIAGAVLSLVMNNIAAAAVLLPATMGIARARKISPSKLLMPLAFGTLLGDMATLLTTSSATLRDANYPAFGLLDFAPIGGLVVIVGILYMAVIGRRWRPCRTRLISSPSRTLRGPIAQLGRCVCGGPSSRSDEPVLYGSLARSLFIGGCLVYNPFHPRFDKERSSCCTNPYHPPAKIRRGLTRCASVSKCLRSMLFSMPALWPSTCLIH